MLYFPRRTLDTPRTPCHVAIVLEDKLANCHQTRLVRIGSRNNRVETSTVILFRYAVFFMFVSQQLSEHVQQHKFKIMGALALKGPWLPGSMNFTTEDLSRVQRAFRPI